ncbi:MAG: lipoyl(octanoyl) transferase LipB [Planctomycetota bacterium]|nr:lipoyl(octanoyl) transferase LipB [Planctomycetota bacterium]
MTEASERHPDGVLDVRRLGRTSYEDAWRLQKELVDQRADDALGDVLLLTEHEPVVTVGRGTSEQELAAIRAAVDVPVVEVERGGEATYHGPGQLVVYPILKLPEARRDLHRYMRDLEEVVLGVLREFELEGSRREGYTGVWLGDRKIASIGVAVRRWVTWHGLALNLTTDLTAFRSFHPCGLDPDVMTRLADHVELPPTNILGEVLVVKHLCRVFELELPPPQPLQSPPEDPDAPGFLQLPILPG